MNNEEQIPQLIGLSHYKYRNKQKRKKCRNVILSSSSPSFSSLSTSPSSPAAILSSSPKQSPLPHDSPSSIDKKDEDQFLPNPIKQSTFSVHNDIYRPLPNYQETIDKYQKRHIYRMKESSLNEIKPERDPSISKMMNRQSIPNEPSDSISDILGSFNEPYIACTPLMSPKWKRYEKTNYEEELLHKFYLKKERESRQRLRRNIREHKIKPNDFDSSCNLIRHQSIQKPLAVKSMLDYFNEIEREHQRQHNRRIMPKLHQFVNRIVPNRSEGEETNLSSSNSYEELEQLPNANVKEMDENEPNGDIPNKKNNEQRRNKEGQNRKDVIGHSKTITYTNNRDSNNENENGVKNGRFCRFLLNNCCCFRKKHFPPTIDNNNNNTNHTIDNEETPPKNSFIKTITTFVVDENQSYGYRWMQIMTIAILYNLIIPIARACFPLLQTRYHALWLTLDYISDAFYILDSLYSSRCGYLEEGILVTDIKKLRQRYLHSTKFLLDVISLLPTDLLYLVPSIGFEGSYLRFNRILRIRQMNNFITRTETLASSPNAFRIAALVVNILIIIHWNACIYFGISRAIGIASDGWVYPGGRILRDAGSIDAPLLHTYNSSLQRQYIYCFYWSTLILTTVGEVPPPETELEYIFVTCVLLVGVLIFATIVGNVGSIISNTNALRTEFQQKVDAVKQYMIFRKVSPELERKVVKWFDYRWSNRQALDEDKAMSALPAKLRNEIAIHVHLDTLKRIKIFEGCEPGLLVELVSRLRLVVFSPGDYICRKGDVGKEMYIIKRGKLVVVAEDGETIFATMQAGKVFGEISVLNIPGNKTGNRRSANVRSVGYSDLFTLTKEDLWEVLTEYPDAKQPLLDAGKAMLRKDKLLDEDVAEREQINQMDAKQKIEKILKTIDHIETCVAKTIIESRSNYVGLKQRISTLESQNKQI
ncbi:hypothetical protein SNEBB_010141 [Seison nebaliae]|nr:hypothetical protein SNEBB_010141 [Seison nebaliae]